MATPTTEVLDPYAYTAAGHLGTHRETMLQNELLIRDRLGCTKKRDIYFPSSNIYGMPNLERNGGSAEALRGWSNGSPPNLPFHRQQRNSERDFLAMNIAAVQAGLVSAPEYYQFRATNEMKKKVAAEEKHKARARRLPPTVVYGISTRPSTPIFDLLENKYQDRWLKQRRNNDLSKTKEITKKTAPLPVYETRASLLRSYQHPVEDGPLWQMPRFSKSAQAHLQTFRSSSAQKKAYDHFHSDRIARKGLHGHGAYESAKN